MKQFDLEAFKAFVAGKPAGERYNGVDPSTCALAQFGFPMVDRDDARRLGIPEEVYHDIVLSGSFGRLTRRLEPRGPPRWLLFTVFVIGPGCLIFAVTRHG